MDLCDYIFCGSSCDETVKRNKEGEQDMSSTNSTNQKDTAQTKNMNTQAQHIELPANESIGIVEPVAYLNGAMPTGVTVSHQGRIFINFPRWGDEVPFTVSELHDANKEPAYPDEAINQINADDPADVLVSVQSVVVDPLDRLWILDTGSPMFQPTNYGGPKMVCVDLATDKVVKKILFPQDVALPTSYLNDVRFDPCSYNLA